MQEAAQFLPKLGGLTPRGLCSCVSCRPSEAGRSSLRGRQGRGGAIVVQGAQEWAAGVALPPEALTPDPWPQEDRFSTAEASMVYPEEGPGWGPRWCGP